MQTLGILARLAKVEAALTKEQQRTWAADLYETQLADQQKRIADLEAMLGTAGVWYEIEVNHNDGNLPTRSARLPYAEASALTHQLRQGVYRDHVRLIRVTITETVIGFL